MSQRDFYAILGVPAQAEPGEIRRAYRRLVFSVHPDVGDRPDPERFRAVHEAYEIRRDSDRRRAYDIKSVTGRHPLSAEAPLRTAPIWIRDEFLTVEPSSKEVLDHVRPNFFGYQRKSGGPYRRIGIEAILEPDEARFGCRVPLKIPCHVRRRRCRGTGEWWGLCSACHGRGMTEGAKQLVLEISPGFIDGNAMKSTWATLDCWRSGLSCHEFSLSQAVDLEHRALNGTAGGEIPPSRSS
jgi:DnaJ-class molecular chaperone